MIIAAASSQTGTSGSTRNVNQRAAAAATRADPRFVITAEAALGCAFLRSVAASIPIAYRKSKVDAIRFSFKTEAMRVSKAYDYQVVIGPLSPEEGGGYVATVSELPGLHVRRRDAPESVRSRLRR